MSKQVFEFEDQELCRVLWAKLVADSRVKDGNYTVVITAEQTGPKGFKVVLKGEPAA